MVGGRRLFGLLTVTGGWPDEIKEELADALFAKEGLDFNIGRYNIGGGDSPETKPYMRKGAAVPGYWNRPDEFGPPEDAGDDWSEPKNWWDADNPDHWNWEADANQQWWVKAARDRGANIFEAFSNSPPYFMTQSGFVSGNKNSRDDNLKPDQYENFSVYLTKVVEHLQEELDIDIQTLSPVNEPNNGYWGAGGRQEGGNWSPASQSKIINAVKEQLDKSGLKTVVAAMDETNPQRFRENWNQYNEMTKGNVGQLNVHTYGTSQRTAVRDIAKSEEKRLWMSEVDLGPGGMPQNFEDIRPALALSERIQSDIQELEPKAWVFWQAIEDEVNMNAQNENMNWGLIHVDFDPKDFNALKVNKNKKYYAMGNYSKFIRPGFQFINSNNRETLAAIDAENETLVLVHTNHSKDEKAIDFDLSGFSSVKDNATATPHVTSAADNLKQGTDVAISNNRLSTVVKPESVTTFVVSGVSGVNPETSFLNQQEEYKLINKNSGKVMDIGKDGKSIVQKTNSNELENQQWKIEKITDGYSAKESFKIVNQASGEALGVVDGNVALTENNENAVDQKWILSTFGNGEYTVMNAQERTLLEVGGSSRADDAGIGLWMPNAGNNQVWQIVKAGIVDIESVDVVTFPGIAPILPEEVKVIYGDGEVAKKGVKWDPIDSEQYQKENVFLVEGKIEGTNVSAKATITVSQIASIEAIKLKTVPGQAPALPNKVQADLGNGKKGFVPVTWADIDPEKYAKLGKFVVEGSIEDSDAKVHALVQVVKPALENIALNPRGSNQEYPKAAASFTGQYDKVAHINDGDYSSERWTNWSPNRWRAEDWVSIDFGKEDTISKVDFTFYDDQSGTRPPASLHLEYWNEGKWVEIPGTHLDIDPKVRTTEATVSFEPVTTSQIRVMMTSMEGPCIAIVEIEVYGTGLGQTPGLGDDATLEGITVEGKDLKDFDPNEYSYIVDVLEGAELPAIGVVTNDLFAEYEIKLGDPVVITVTSEDGKQTQDYTLEINRIPVKEGILSLENKLNEFIASGDVKKPLSKQLSNRVDQVKHQFEKGHEKQASKHLEDFLKHLNNGPMQQHVSDEAKSELEEMVNGLLGVL